MEVGDLATWVTALVTAGALIAAGIAVKYAKRAAEAGAEQLRIEQDRDRARDAEAAELRERAERAEQADLVAAWRHFERPNLNVVPGGGWGAMIVNSSPLPVFDVIVDFHGPGGDVRGNKELTLVTPGQTFIQQPGNLYRGRENPTVARDFRVGLHFRDTAGRVWHRDEHGQLNLEGRVEYV